MRFLTFFYFASLAIFSSLYSVVNATLPLPDLSVFDLGLPRHHQSVQDIVDGWSGDRRWMQGTFYLFDTETTGVTADDRIVQIAFYKIVNGNFTGEAFNRYINPCRPSSAGAYQAHGLTKDFLSKQPKFSDVFSDIRDFCGERPLLVAHNAQFDLRMLRQEVERLVHIAPWIVYFKCTLAMARRDYKRSLTPHVPLISPAPQQALLKDLPYGERRKRLRERQDQKIEKDWNREESYLRRQEKRTGLSQKEARNDRKRKRASLQELNDSKNENQENMSPNVETFLIKPPKKPSSKKGQRKKARPSFALGALLTQIDTSPRRAVQKYGFSLPVLCDQNGIPLQRQHPHDGFWDVGMLVALTDQLKEDDGIAFLFESDDS